MFDNNLRKTTRGKTLGLDNIPNEILKRPPPNLPRHAIPLLHINNATTKKTYHTIGNTTKNYSFNPRKKKKEKRTKKNKNNNNNNNNNKNPNDSNNIRRWSPNQKTTYTSP
jgi:hypothetical protein